jgi:hypothetical protein
MAPEALQGTPFEKHGRADAGAVVEGKPLNVEHHARSGHLILESRSGNKKGVRDPAVRKLGRLVKELV